MSLMRTKDYIYIVTDNSMVPYKSSYMLCYEVDKPYKVLIKISSAMEYIKLNIQNIEAPRIDDPII